MKAKVRKVPTVTPDMFDMPTREAFLRLVSREIIKSLSRDLSIPLFLAKELLLDSLEYVKTDDETTFFVNLRNERNIIKEFSRSFSEVGSDI